MLSVGEAGSLAHKNTLPSPTPDRQIRKGAPHWGTRKAHPDGQAFPLFIPRRGGGRHCPGTHSSGRRVPGPLGDLHQSVSGGLRRPYRRLLRRPPVGGRRGCSLFFPYPQPTKAYGRPTMFHVKHLGSPVRMFAQFHYKTWGKEKEPPLRVALFLFAQPVQRQTGSKICDAVAVTSGSTVVALNPLVIVCRIYGFFLVGEERDILSEPSDRGVCADCEHCHACALDQEPSDDNKCFCCFHVLTLVSVTADRQVYACLLLRRREQVVPCLLAMGCYCGSS